MKHLPYDICLRLRDAGLPQPEGAIGQFWYLTRYPGGTLENDVLSVVMQHYSNSKNLTFMPLDGGNNPNQRLKIFCPNAEYILSLMSDENWYIYQYKGRFYCTKDSCPYEDGLHFEADNMDEAAALAYLNLHEKTPAP